MMGWQWRQVDHMQIICTSVQTDNHASTSPQIHLLTYLFRLRCRLCLRCCFATVL